jgi:low temperature requirement protein LtrA
VSDVALEREHRVSPIELFFDLVFVFGFTQVTTLWLEQDSWAGLGRGLLVLVVLWWVWASYAWLTNAANADSTPVFATLLVATAASFVVALAVPEAFGAHRELFGVALLVVLAAFVGLYAFVSKAEPELLAAVLRGTRTIMPAAILVLVAAFVPAGMRPALWGAALLVGFVGPVLMNLGGWRIQPAHFAERHNLIVIIAIGESLSAIGFGARDTNLGAGVMAAVVLGLVIAASFWLAYFDFASVGVQRLLAARRGVQQIAFARDAYTYAHLPMVGGVILFAFAMRTALPHVHADLGMIPAVALCCGSALYLAAFVALRWRVDRRLGRGRPIAAIAFASVTPIAVHVSALATLALIAGLWLGLHAYELIRWRDERARRRAPVDAATTPAHRGIGPNTFVS